MEYRQLYENAIIVAPKSEWDYFYAYRKQYPEAQFSLYSEEDLESLFAYHYDDRAVVALLEKGFSYERTLDSLNAIALLHCSDDADPKIHSLCLLRDELRKASLLYEDVAPERTFLGKSLVIHGYHDGKRISLAIKDLPNMTISYDPVSQPNSPLPELHRFDDIYGELHYVFNRIAALIDSKVDPDDIYLAGVDSSYTYLLSFMATAYGFTVELPSSRTLMDLPIGRNFVNEVALVGVDTALENIAKRYPDDLNLPLLHTTVLRYRIARLDNEAQANLYRDIFLSLREHKPKLSHAVHVMGDWYPPEHAHIFFLGFALDNAPHRHNDDDFISDSEKARLLLATSRDLFLEEKADLIALLRSGQIESLSFKAKAPGSIYFDSPLVSELGLTNASSNELPYEYSKPFASLWLSSLKDSEDKYLKTDKRIAFLEDSLGSDWKSYDYRYTPFAVFAPNSPRKYSYSSVETFYLCQFRYYLSYVLQINDEEPIFNAKFGTAFHQVLQHLYDPDFNFEAAWMDALSDIESKPQNGPFTPREQVLLIRLHDELLSTVKFLQAHEAKMTSPRFLTEKGFRFPLAANSELIGRIDKIVATGPHSEYLTLIDYKTGAEDFDESLYEFGLSLQLPLYAYVALHDEDFKDGTLLGLFIDHILAKKLVKSSGTDYSKFHDDQLMLKGIYLADEEAIKTFEPDYAKSTFIRSLSWTEKNGFSRKAKGPKSAEELQATADFAFQKVQEADQKVRAYDFTINPKKYGSKVDSCGYCPFRDVCYVRDEARLILHKKKADGTEESGNEEDNDE